MNSFMGSDNTLKNEPPLTKTYWHGVRTLLQIGETLLVIALLKNLIEKLLKLIGLKFFISLALCSL